jgi:LCP family protein required for cell wall assembly
MAMSDDRGGPSEYDWLYSSAAARSERRNPPERPEPPHEEPAAGDSQQPDNEATRAVPAASSDGDAEPTRPVAGPPHPTVDPDATQAMPAADRENGPASEPDEGGSEHTQVIDRPSDGHDRGDGSDGSEDATPEHPSFGGVYAPPPPGTQRRTDLRRPPGAPPAPPPSARPPTKKATPSGGSRKRRNWWLIGILAVLGAWLIFLIVVPIWAWQQISKVDAEPDGNRPSDTPGTTYLLVGSDSRAGLSKDERRSLGTGQAAGKRTDTIILLHVPAGDGPRLLLSIPRDSYVDIPGHGKNKINAAYSFGGPRLLVATVEKATGIRIDDYIEVGFTGFVDIVDAVGGITVCPETSVNDPKAGGLKMKKGCQEVDGQTALDYSRSRAFPLGDITRAEHQREVITQVGKKAASWQTVVFPWRYWQVNHAAAESLRIGDNVGPIDLTRFAWAMAHTGGSDSKRCVVPYTSLGTPTAVGSVVTWDEKAAKALFQAVRQDDTASIKCYARGR